MPDMLEKLNHELRLFLGENEGVSIDEMSMMLLKKKIFEFEGIAVEDPKVLVCLTLAWKALSEHCRELHNEK